MNRLKAARLRVLLVAGLLYSVMGFFACTVPAPAQAAVGINKTINFQGKVTNADGTNVTDNTYYFNFKIYTVASGGTAIWSELSKQVSVTDGIFQTALGSATTLPGSVDFNSDNIYLGITFNNDAAGEMSPRVQFTASPYSFNTNLLDGLHASAFGQLTTSNLFKPGSNSLTALQVQPAASTTPVLDVDTTNSRVGIGTATPAQALDVQGGDINVSGAYRQGGSNIGQTSACSANKFLQNQITSGGIVTGGACATIDIQSTYDNSTSPATVSLATSAKNYAITATDQTVDPSIIFNLACATCSAGGGRFAVQDNGTDVLTVNPGGSLTVAPTAGQNISFNLGAGSTAAIAATAPPTTDMVGISNAGQPTITDGVDGLSITYVGGAISSGGEGNGQRIDITPGSTSPSTWNGQRIVASGGAGSGVAFNGIKLDGPASPGAGTEIGLNITTGWDVGVNVQSGGIQLASFNDPVTPSAGNLRVYAQDVSGRTLLKALGSSGVDYAYQPSLFQQSVFLVTPGSDATTTTYTSTGGSITKVGTLNATGGATSETQGFMANIASAASANSGAGVGNAGVQYYRGSAPGNANGFFYFTRISLPDAIAKYKHATTGSRLFFGLTDQTVATNSTMITTDTPSGNFAGFSFSGVRDLTSGVFQFSTRNGTTQTNTSTGVTLAVGKTYDFYVYCSQQCSTINWRIENLTDGTAPVEGSTSATLPTNTVAMRCMDIFAPLEFVAHNIRFQRLYCETDR